MPTCPNCGSYIPLGNNSCACGTTIAYDDEDHSSGYYDVPDRIKYENPYDIDFFNELYHAGISRFVLDMMYESVRDTEKKYGVRLVKSRRYRNGVFFNFLKEEKYFDATLRGVFDIDQSYEIKIFEDLVTPDFSKLHASPEINKIIRDMEIKTESKFHHFKMMLVCDEVMVSAIFDNRGYIIDFDNMRLVE